MSDRVGKENREERKRERIEEKSDARRELRWVGIKWF